MKAENALNNLSLALTESKIDGVQHNGDWLLTVLKGKDFQTGSMTTRGLSKHLYSPKAFEILEPGAHTSIQDLPGRVGYWSVGIPPSGPMDSLSFRLANELIGNEFTAPALELTLKGPKIKFHSDTVIALTGAVMPPLLDGQPIEWGKAIAIKAGQTLSLGLCKGPGLRAYLAVHGGIEAPDYLDSASTFDLGKMGGYSGRTLRPGDVLYWASSVENYSTPSIDSLPRFLCLK